MNADTKPFGISNLDPNIVLIRVHPSESTALSGDVAGFWNLHGGTKAQHARNMESVATQAVLFLTEIQSTMSLLTVRFSGSE